MRGGLVLTGTNGRRNLIDTGYQSKWRGKDLAFGKTGGKAVTSCKRQPYSSHEGGLPLSKSMTLFRIPSSVISGRKPTSLLIFDMSGTRLGISSNPSSYASL